MVKKRKPSDRMASKGFPNPIDVHVGMRIREKRTLIGMTQIELAKALGVEFQQVQKYEKAANRVSASRLWDIGRVLNVPITYFFQGLNGTLEMKEFKPMDKETLALIKIWKAIKDKLKRRMVLRIINNLVKK